MSVIINPGSRLPTEPQGWTNTHEGAKREAAQWLARMHADGFGDIEMTDTGETDGQRWTFEFRHLITRVTVKLETHGIDDLDAYLKQSIFSPRVYWNGSSSSNPSMDDFAAPGYVMTFREAGAL
jgi:hypothetical protein